MQNYDCVRVIEISKGTNYAFRVLEPLKHNKNLVRTLEIAQRVGCSESHLARVIRDPAKYKNHLDIPPLSFFDHVTRTYIWEESRCEEYFAGRLHTVEQRLAELMQQKEQLHESKLLRQQSENLQYKFLDVNSEINALNKIRHYPKFLHHLRYGLTTTSGAMYIFPKFRSRDKFLRMLKENDIRPYWLLKVNENRDLPIWQISDIERLRYSLAQDKFQEAMQRAQINIEKDSELENWASDQCIQLRISGQLAKQLKSKFINLVCGLYEVPIDQVNNAVGKEIVHVDLTISDPLYRSAINYWNYGSVEFAGFIEPYRPQPEFVRIVYLEPEPDIELNNFHWKSLGAGHNLVQIHKAFADSIEFSGMEPHAKRLRIPRRYWLFLSQLS